MDLYEKRLKGRMHLSWYLYRDEGQLERNLKHSGIVCLLDPAGELYDSPSFATKLSTSLHWTFLIGGSTGFSDAFKSKIGTKISLSKMTFTHEATRFLLAEQLYRAVDILSNGHYHK